MTRNFASVLLLAGLTLLASCSSSPRIHTATSEDANFKSYVTYSFIQSSKNEEAEGLHSQYLRSAIQTEMDSRGYRHQEDDPDLELDYFYVVHQISQNVARPDIGARCTNVGSGSCVGQFRKETTYDTEVVKKDRPTLIIRMIDPGEKQVAWEGVAVITNSDMKRDLKQAINESVAAVYNEFPHSVDP